MATEPTDIFRPAAADAPPPAPLAGTRSQSMQRLQVGLFGLAAMVLLVSLANIILNNARENEARVVPEAAPSLATSPTSTPIRDPLAEAGVVPDMPEQSESQGSAAQQRQAGDAAPALQP